MKRPTSEQPAAQPPKPTSGAAPAQRQPRPNVVTSFAEFQAEAPRVPRNPGAQPALVCAVPSALPLDRLMDVGARPGGDVFHLGASAVSRMEVVARQRTRHLELSFGLTPHAARQFDENASALDQIDMVMGGHATRAQARFFEHPGKFIAEYVPSTGPQAWAGRLRLAVLGASNATRAQNLTRGLEALGAPRVLDPAEKYQGECYRRFCVLRQLNPRAAELLARQLTSVQLEQLDLALAQAGTDPLRVIGSRLDEVLPGHSAIVDPMLGAQYVQLGVRAVLATHLTPEAAAAALQSGLLSRCEAMARGTATLPGGPELEVSGGADFALARMVTRDAVKQNIELALWGPVQLVSAGPALTALLSRTDWHAAAKASDGSTVSDAQTGAPPGTGSSSFSARPVLGGLMRALHGDGFDVVTWQDVAHWPYDHELWFQRGIAPTAFTHVLAANEATKAALLALGVKLPVHVATRWGDVETALA